MPDITISPDLWSTNLLPEGILEKWCVEGGSLVEARQAVASVRIGSDLHTILAPQAGLLVPGALVNAIVEPGSIIGEIRPAPKWHSGAIDQQSVTAVRPRMA